MILPTQAPAAPKVHLPPLMQPHDDIDPPTQQQGDLPIGAVEAIRQDHIVPLKMGMQAMKEHDLTGLLPLDAPHCRCQARATGQRQHDDEAGNRKAEPRRLAARLWIVLLVRLRVWHGDPRAVHDLHCPSVPVPGPGCLLLEPMATQVHQAGQQRLGPTVARLAVAAGEGRTQRQALGNARSIETRDRRTARGVITMDLPQEGPECDHGSEDAVAGLTPFLANPVDDVLARQHGAEGSRAVLQEPAEQVR